MRVRIGCVTAVDGRVEFTSEVRPPDIGLGPIRDELAFER